MHEIQVYLQSHVTIITIIEILLLTFIFYQIFKWISGTQAEQVIKGFILLLFLLPLCNILGLNTLSFLLRSIFTWIFLLIIIVFQPELRSALEQLGNSIFLFSGIGKNRQIDKIERSIYNLKEAVRNLAKEHTGALIVCVAKTGLKNIEDTGTKINADISYPLLSSIFFNNSALHDGAVIVTVTENRIDAAGCVLPLSDRRKLPLYFGTRHRAGIGISEQSDAITIIVSEETGRITVTRNGAYQHNISPEKLERILLEEYVYPLKSEKKNSFFNKK